MNQPLPRADALVIFGLTGDLGHDELLPAIVLLHATGRLGIPVIGVGRSAPDDIGQVLRDVVGPDLAARAGSTVDRLVGDIDLRFVEGDATEPDTWTRIDAELGGGRLPAVYAALPPALLGEVARCLADSALPDTARLVLEKPFGHDRASAIELHEQITERVDDARLYLVDHFLAKAPIRNLVTFRRSPIFDIAVRADHLESITVDFPESGGLEGRGSFYEGVGGVVPDVVQNHLLQTVACALLDPPPTPATPDAMRRARVELLQRIAPIDRDEAVLGQYRGYRDVDDVDDDSAVPTLLDAILSIDAPRWADIPVRLRTGKRVADGPFEISWNLADRSGGLPHAVRARLKPGPSVRIDLARLDPDTHGTTTSAACTPVEADHGALDAYATLLGDAIVGEQRHMSSIDEIVECWRIVEPILGARKDLVEYDPGTQLADITVQPEVPG
jgi:glucose-6-phosphate 1-dehydrogenase